MPDICSVGLGFNCNGANASNIGCDMDNAAKIVSNISSNALDVIAAISSREESQGTTCISCGLSAAKDLLFANQREDATGAAVIILLTDGRQTVGGTDATVTAEVDAIKAHGFTVLTVGFGDADESLMKSWASSSAYATVGLDDVAAAIAAVPTIVGAACVEDKHLQVLGDPTQPTSTTYLCV